MKKPLVSVIVPIYNAEKYLARCIESIINQIYDKLEIILVDDGSTDESLQICKNFQNTDSRIEIIVQENKGQAAARRAGVMKAAGELIGFVDSDDWVDAAMFQHMVQLVERYDCDLVSAGRILEYGGNRGPREETDNYDEGFYSDPAKEILPTLVYNPETKGHGLTASLWNKLFRRNVLYEIILKKNDSIFYGEDLCIVLDYCLRAKGVCISHKAEYHYRVRSDSVSNRRDEKILLNFYRLYIELEAIARDSGYYFLLMKQIQQYVIELNIIYMRNMFGIDLLARCKWNFSFPQEVLNSSLVIYGAGSCGQAFYRKLLREELQENIVAWIDVRGKEKERECLYKIDTPDKLTKIEFDYIVITVQSAETAQEIQDELCQKYQIDRKKMIWQECDYREDAADDI